MQEQDKTKGKLYDLLVASLPVGLFVVDEKLEIIEFNAEAERLTDWNKDEVIGKQCSEVLQSSLCASKCPLKESAQQQKSILGEKASLLTKWGEEIPIIFSCSVLLGEDGKPAGGIETFRDATVLKKLEVQRKNFISVFAHDLKAPVSIAGGFLRRLLQGKAGPLTEKQQYYLQMIEKETLRLESYVHNFLDVSRVEAGQIQLSLAPWNIEKVLDELVAGFRVKASEKDLAIYLDFPEKLPIVSVDEIQMERVISNLLDNAIKYSSPNSEIVLRAWGEGDFVFIEVRDQGVGISKHDLPYVFEYFYRIREIGQTSGTGLGLAAVRAIVEAHGGSVWVKSEKDKGSSFYIKIPKSR